MQKNQKNLIMVSMRTRVADRHGQTDGAGYIGPAEGYGGSKNRYLKLEIKCLKVDPPGAEMDFTKKAPTNSYKTSPFFKPW